MVKALLVVTMLGMLGTTGHADPTARFGLTGALADQSAPGKYQLGPLVAFGMRSGGFVGELEYAYLSFFDPDTTEGGVHRVGVTLRADLVREIAGLCRLRWACTRSSSIYGEVGAAERFGHWQLDAQHVSPGVSPQPELHVGLGLELDNQLVPHRHGWQLGLRFAVARHDGEVGAACRGSGSSCMSVAPTSNGLDKALFIEWMFTLGG